MSEVDLAVLCKQMRLDVDGETGSIAAAYANNPIQVCRRGLLSRLPCIGAICTTATCTSYCFVQAHSHQSCKCQMLIKTLADHLIHC